jgi:hypothetical protein
VTYKEDCGDTGGDNGGEGEIGRTILRGDNNTVGVVVGTTNVTVGDLLLW